MKDEEALKSHRHEWVCQQANAGHRTTVNALDGYAAGFRAGLAHARQWRPLTADPASWPGEGQWVLLYDGAVTDDDTGTEWNADSVAVALGEGWTHWLPLPPPPKGESK